MAQNARGSSPKNVPTFTSSALAILISAPSGGEIKWFSTWERRAEVYPVRLAMSCRERPFFSRSSRTFSPTRSSSDLFSSSIRSLLPGFAFARVFGKKHPGVFRPLADGCRVGREQVVRAFVEDPGQGGDQGVEAHHPGPFHKGPDDDHVG